MRNTKAMLAVMVGGALAAPQATQKAPEGPTPSGCSSSYDGEFEITIIAAPEGEGSSKMKRQQEGAGPLILKLQDGVLTDGEGRTGSIVANRQFQFDNPVQPDAIYTSGFSVCDDNGYNLLAIGDNKTFYKCASGKFSNLYDESQGKQCQPIAFTVSPAGGSSGSTGGGSSPGASVTQIGDGQPQGPTGTAPAGAPVSQIPDGQPQAPTGAPPKGEPVTQIPDGQPQAPTGAPPKGEPVSQIPDGQPQAPTGTPPKGQPVSQIPDGQPQAPTGAPPTPPKGQPVSQIPDGQPQAPTGVAPMPPAGQPVSQIPDGQPQAPTGAAPMPPAGQPVSQIPDGQPQGPTGAAPTGQPVSQIPDGQPQAPTDTPPAPVGNTTAAPSGPLEVSPNAGARALSVSVIAVALGVAGLFFVI